MRILKNFPLFRRTLDFLFVLEGLGGAAEVDRITAVFLLAENIRHGSRTPVVRDGGRHIIRQAIMQCSARSELF